MSVLLDGSEPLVHPLPDSMWGGHDGFDERASRTEARGQRPCQMCGRPVRRGWEVMAVDGGASLLAVSQWGQADLNDAGFMGVWELGPECGRTVPKEYRRGVRD